MKDNFRLDINGLRALALILVVLFHFNSTLFPAGFIGVDIFFVISGYLMTKIIVNKLDVGEFYLIEFYISRANRIVPSLFFVCLFLLIFGYFFLSPYDYRLLGKHTGTSILFFSNMIYLREAGYFDSSSLDKWLLHTWSLSVEWQFYLLFPILILFSFRLLRTYYHKYLILLLAVFTYLFGIVLTSIDRDLSYYFLPSRSWEMLAGSLVFLFSKDIADKYKRVVLFFGFFLIFISLFLFSEKTPWPGAYALVPVVGAGMVIFSNSRDNYFLNNMIMQTIGRSSYSIYLWHWPILLLSDYFDYSEFWWLGVIFSIIIGYLCYFIIEKRKYSTYRRIRDIYLVKPVYMCFFITLLSVFVFYNNGIKERYPVEFNIVSDSALTSPKRTKCHTSQYQDPNDSCQYFTDDVTWAVIGDSHTVELSYSLAEQLRKNGIGLKHFSFSSCVPSYNLPDDFDRCSRWYNDSINYILNNSNIKNVVLLHRYTEMLFPGEHDVEKLESLYLSEKSSQIMPSFFSAITELSKVKEHVYVFYPVPQLSEHVKKIIGDNYNKNLSLDNLLSQPELDYEYRNRFILGLFDNAHFPSNVHFIKSAPAFCHDGNCFSVKNSKSLYFDDNHPSLYGTEKMVELLNSFSN